MFQCPCISSHCGDTAFHNLSFFILVFGRKNYFAEQKDVTVAVKQAEVTDFSRFLKK